MKYERVTCGRCGGCGEFSYCERFGRVCFKCSGTGEQLTRRGKATLAWVNEQIAAHPAELCGGDLIRDFDGKVYRVDSVEFLPAALMGYSDQDCWRWLVKATRVKTGAPHSFGGFSSFKRALTGAEKRELAARAEVYQASLTKAGKPRKVRTT